MSDTADGAVPTPHPLPLTAEAVADAPLAADGTDLSGDPSGRANRRRRRGSRGGKSRSRTRVADGSEDDADDADDDDREGDDDAADGQGTDGRAPSLDDAPSPVAHEQPDLAEQPDLPDPPNEGRVTDLAVAERALVRRPQIGDSRPAPAGAATAPALAAPIDDGERTGAKKGRRRGGRGKGAGTAGTGSRQPAAGRSESARNENGRGDGGGRQTARSKRVERADAVSDVLDAEQLEKRRGRERKGRPVGRYLMTVHVRPELSQIAVLEGRSLIEHYVSRPSDDVGQIHGNIYMGRVQNVLPGMEAAFVDISTPKNAVLYRGDLTYDLEDVESKGNRNDLRIEQMLKPRQLILCQVTKNPIGAKGARLTQEVSLPGRFVVLIPNSKTYGISKRLPDDERKRLRAVLDKVKPAEHGVIVRTAAENVSSDELRVDVERLLAQWERVEVKARRVNSPSLLYREPDMAVRVIREEFNPEYRGVVIDDRELYEEVRSYVGTVNPDLVDRIEYYDAEAEGMPIFERHHVHEQLHKALDRKVWLPSGGSLIIEHTEALTVIDVNTGKNVGTTNLEETVYRNNLEAAEEIARQLRLRDIGGIIVIDFIDMEIRENRAKVVHAFRDALARDKTRTQVFDISELGLVEMTRKRIGEGLLTSFANPCPLCEGRGIKLDVSLID